MPLHWLAGCSFDMQDPSWCLFAGDAYLDYIFLVGSIKRMRWNYYYPVWLKHQILDFTAEQGVCRLRCLISDYHSSAFGSGGKSRLLVGEMQSGWNGKINDYMQLNYKLLVKFETTIIIQSGWEDDKEDF